MRLLLVIVGLTVTVTAHQRINNDYHNTIGIFEAARIKQAEESADFDGARITGGSSATLGQFPFLGGLLISLTTGQTSVCGSSLISNTRLVTAAHCWRSTKSQAVRFTVVLGSIRLNTGGTRIITNNVRVHGWYSQQTLVNDIAVIVINHVNYNNNIRNINLASGNNQYVFTTATAAGFGATSGAVNAPVSQTLNHVTLQVITNALCRSVYGSSVIDSTLCVATPSGRSICGGDSGGPLAIGAGNNRLLIGVTSFSHRDGCTRGHPAGFARVTSFNVCNMIYVSNKPRTVILEIIIKQISVTFVFLFDGDDTDVLFPNV